MGTIGSDGDYRITPSLAVNACSDALIGYTRSSSTTYPSIHIATRLAHLAPGQVGTEFLAKAGEVTYAAFDGSPYRWGDYSGATMAPEGEAFWYLGLYSEDTGSANGRWGTYVYQTASPACEVYTTYIPLVVRN